MKAYELREIAMDVNKLIVGNIAKDIIKVVNREAKKRAKSGDYEFEYSYRLGDMGWESVDLIASKVEEYYRKNGFGITTKKECKNTTRFDEYGMQWTQPSMILDVELSWLINQT